MQNPNLSVQQRLNMAMQLMHAGEFEQALSHFLILKKLGLADFRLSRAIGSAYERLSKDVEAQQYFVESLGLNPKQPDLYYALANIAFRAKDFERAIKHFKQSLNLDNSKAQVWLKLGHAYLSSHQLGLAEQAFVNCKRLQPSSVEAVIGQCRVLQQRKQYQEAEQLLTLLSQSQPNNLRVLSELAWLHKEQGKFSLAAELFKKRLSQDPNNPEYYEDLALVNLDLGQPESALDVLQKGLGKSPQNRKLNQLYSALKYEMNDPDHLYCYKRNGFETMPNELIVDYLVGLIKTDQLEQVKQQLSKLNAIADKKVIANKIQLLLWEKENNYIPVIEHFKNMQSHNANLSRAEKERLVKAYLAVGDNLPAQTLINKMLVDSPDDQFLWALKTTVLCQLQSSEYDILCDYDSMVFKQQLLLNNSSGNIEQFNQRLRLALNNLHTSKQNPLDQSLRNGTQTTGSLFSHKVPVIEELKVALKNTIDSLLVDLNVDQTHPFYRHVGKPIEFSANWSVKLNHQGFHVSHVHPKGWLSSAFYVHLPDAINDESKQGWLQFGKPGISLPVALEAEKWVKPVVGQLVLFPSYFWHGTEPFEDKQERMSVAFDLIPSKYP